MNGSIEMKKLLLQYDTITVTEDPNPSYGWTVVTITFQTSFKSVPLISILPYNTSIAHSWPIPAIRNITKTGFQLCWHLVTGKDEFIWQAYGEV